MLTPNEALAEMLLRVKSLAGRDGSVEEVSIGNRAAVWWGAALLAEHTEALRWVVVARTTMLRDLVQRAAESPDTVPALTGLGVVDVRLDGKDFLAALDGLRQGAIPSLRVLHLEEVSGGPAAQDWASLCTIPGLEALSVRMARNTKRWASIRPHLKGLDRLHLSSTGPTTLTYTGEAFDHLVVHGPGAALAKAAASAPTEGVTKVTQVATDGPEPSEFPWARPGALPSFWG